MSSKEYNASSIEVLSGLDPVKKRPGMYTDTSCPNHLLQEVIDNAVDEALAGYANEIIVTLSEEGCFSVEDNGRGMPIDWHPEHQVSGVELILTRLHAGGKFNQDTYQYSGGLHGVGVSVVNALSKRLDVVVWRQKKAYGMHFINAEKASELTEITGSVPVKKQGTKVSFWIDEQYFDNANVAFAKLKATLKAKAILCRGLTIILRSSKHLGDEEVKWYYESDLSDYLLDALKDNNHYLPLVPFAGSQEDSLYTLEWALTWSISGLKITESYVNLIPTLQGGSHVNGLKAALFEAIKEFCDRRELLPKQLKLTADDVFEDCTFVLSLKMADPQFSGQTKERLSSRVASGIVSSVIKDALSLYLHQHVAIGEQIAAHIIEAAMRRQQTAHVTVRKKMVSGPKLPGKLADCVSTDVSLTELFLVEGDSAGGSAKQARNKDYQAIMPLRGKILNTWEINSLEALGSQEIRDIATAIGVEPNSRKLEDLRYGKICIMADADSDGLHIATLLCALFLKHFQPLVTAGKVFVVMPPLYRIDHAKEIYYAIDDDERQSIVQKIYSQKKNPSIQVTRFKGLGEMNPNQLKETAMDPQTRRLMALTSIDLEKSTQLFSWLLGKKFTADRRHWLEKKGDMIEI